MPRDCNSGFKSNTPSFEVRPWARPQWDGARARVSCEGTCCEFRDSGTLCWSATSLLPNGGAVLGVNYLEGFQIISRNGLRIAHTGLCLFTRGGANILFLNAQQTHVRWRNAKVFRQCLCIFPG